MTFQRGDRVRFLGSDLGAPIAEGELGTVVHFAKSGGIGVRWDMAAWGFHTCSGRCDNLHGYYVPGYELELYEGDADPEQAFEIDAAVFEEMFSL